MRLAHRAQAGEQQKRAAAARFHRGQCGFNNGTRVIRGIRFGQLLRHIEQPLIGEIEGTRPAFGLRRFDAQFTDVMREVAVDRQRRRRKHPGFRLRLDLLTEDFRNRQRRGVELHRLVEHFHPAHQTGIAVFTPAGELATQTIGTFETLSQPFAARRLCMEGFGQLCQFFCCSCQRLGHRLAIAQRDGRQTRTAVLERQPQVTRRLLQCIRLNRQLRRILGAGRAFDARITRQIHQLRRRHRLPEKQAGGFRQLVRLVENHRVAGRQDFRDTLVAQHHIGKKQMVVNHHHIRLQRLLARLHHKTFVVVLALRSETVIAG